MTDTEKFRPDVEHRWIEDRTEPATIAVRTRFLYSDPSERTKLPAGRTRWAFSRNAEVVDGGEWSTPYDHLNSLASHVHRMAEAFGDDAELVVTVRRRTPPAPDSGEHDWHRIDDGTALTGGVGFWFCSRCDREVWDNGVVRSGTTDVCEVGP